MKIILQAVSICLLSFMLVLPSEARYYNSATGRFLQEDPVGGVLEVPQTENLYTYSMNNPTLLTDPNGEAVPLVVVIIAAGGIISGSVEAISVTQEPNSVFRESLIFAFARGFASGAVGTAAGLSLGVGASPFAVGLLAGFSSNLTQQLIQQKGRFDCLDALALARGAGLGVLSANLPVKNIPGFATKGRLPNLLKPRRISEFGPNSVRLIGQEATLGAAGGVLETVLP